MHDRERAGVQDGQRAKVRDAAGAKVLHGPGADPAKVTNIDLQIFVTSL
jgi:hypothetical protein